MPRWLCDNECPFKQVVNSITTVVKKRGCLTIVYGSGTANTNDQKA